MRLGLGAGAGMAGRRCNWQDYFKSLSRSSVSLGLRPFLSSSGEATLSIPRSFSAFFTSLVAVSAEAVALVPAGVAEALPASAGGGFFFFSAAAFSAAALSAAMLGFLLGLRHATDADHVVAVTAIVARERKVSTSYIQRRLQIGYNRAASIMERMEHEGVVGQANHAGKREILMGQEEHQSY